MQASKYGASVARAMNVRQSCEAHEHQQNGQHPCQLVGDAAQDGVHPQKVELWDNVGWGAVRVGRYIIVRMPQCFRPKTHKTRRHGS